MTHQDLQLPHVGHAIVSYPEPNPTHGSTQPKDNSAVSYPEYAICLVKRILVTHQDLQLPHVGHAIVSYPEPNPTHGSTQPTDNSAVSYPEYAGGGRSYDGLADQPEVPLDQRAPDLESDGLPGDSAV